MKNRATVFSVESAEMTTRKFAIVRTPEKAGNDPMSARRDNLLKEYLLRVMREENLSFQKIEDNARDRGGTLGRGTIQQIARGDTTNPGIFTLVELSWGIKRPPEEVIKVALGDLLVNTEVFDKSAMGRVWLMTDRLPDAEQRHFKRFLKMLEHEIKRVLGSE